MCITYCYVNSSEVTSPQYEHIRGIRHVINRLLAYDDNTIFTLSYLSHCESDFRHSHEDQWMDVSRRYDDMTWELLDITRRLHMTPSNDDTMIKCASSAGGHARHDIKLWRHADRWTSSAGRHVLTTLYPHADSCSWHLLPGAPVRINTSAVCKPAACYVQVCVESQLVTQSN